MSVPRRIDIAEVVEKHEGVEVASWLKRLFGGGKADAAAAPQARTWYPNMIFIWCALVMMADG